MRYSLHPIRSLLCIGPGPHRSLEIICYILGFGQHTSLVRRKTIILYETGALGGREFGERAENSIAPGGADVDGQEIGLREIAVVVSLFLGTHGVGAIGSLIPQARFLGDAASGFDDADVALDFVFEGFGEIAKRVEVLHFHLGAEFGGATAADADVSIAAKRTFFHIDVADACVEQNLAE